MENQLEHRKALLMHLNLKENLSSLDLSREDLGISNTSL
ncbi:hypothetical protein QE390_004554 [Siphonobacter sp. SORGH_AS 1065]|nr:hypothetical protein [Siphonobacter sp. SORGH_AS_1065]